MADRNVFQCNPNDNDRFCVVAANCLLMDLDASMTFDAFLEQAVQLLAIPAHAAPEQLQKAFQTREAESSTVVREGIAIPHVILEGTSHAVMLLARCREGIWFSAQKEPVFALLMLVEGYEHRYFHLQALAALSRWAHDPDFMRTWITTPTVAELRDTLLELHRTRCTMIQSNIVVG